MNKKPKGWGKPDSSTKWHYFDNSSMSLCHKWGFYFGHAEDSHDDSPDNCSACKKRKAALDRKEPTT